MVHPRRFERLTPSLGGKCSIHLSYGRIAYYPITLKHEVGTRKEKGAKDRKDRPMGIRRSREGTFIKRRSRLWWILLRWWQSQSQYNDCSRRLMVTK